MLPASSITDITALHSSSIQALAPDVVALVDAFDHDDFTLDSALGERFLALRCDIFILILTIGFVGRYDGDVYNGLLERAQWSPLNRSDVLPLFEKVCARSDATAHLTSAEPISPQIIKTNRAGFDSDMASKL